MAYDPDIPYNELPLLPPATDLDDVEILKKVNTANIALARLNGASLAVPNRELLLEPLSVREAVASSGIENINTTVSEVFQAELFPIAEAPKPQKETLHYKRALLFGNRYVKEKGFVATNAIADIQSILEPEKPGIRRLPGTKIADQVSGQIYYTPPDGEERIRGLLKNFDDYFNNTDVEVDPLVRNAILHYQFEAIHPFYDGNGRTGRILMVLHLVLSGRLDLPILFLSGYINNHRSSYYRLLREVTSQEAWKPWILFVLTAIEEQASSTARTIDEMLMLRKKIEPVIHAMKPALPYKELLDYLFSNPYYSRSRLSEAIEVHPNSSLKYLNTLEEAGLVQSFTLRREKLFFMEEFLALL
jgi:Fic family protein